MAERRSASSFEPDPPMEIVPLGDSALIVRVREQFEDAPEETQDQVLQTFRQLRSAAIPGVIELAPAYTSVAVFCDPVEVAKEIGHAAPIQPPQGNSSRCGRDWWRANGNLSAALARRMESDRTNAIKTFRSIEKPACASACGRSCGLSRDQTGRI